MKKIVLFVFLMIGIFIETSVLYNKGDKSVIPEVYYILYSGLAAFYLYKYWNDMVASKLYWKAMLFISLVTGIVEHIPNISKGHLELYNAYDSAICLWMLLEIGYINFIQERE